MKFLIIVAAMMLLSGCNDEEVKDVEKIAEDALSIAIDDKNTPQEAISLVTDAFELAKDVHAGQ